MTDIQMHTRKKLPSLSNYKLVPKKDKPRRVTPSVYTQEMFQSTEELLANTTEVHPPRILELLDMSKTTQHKSSSVNMDKALFQPYPSELVFKNFTPTQTYKLPLVLLNNDKDYHHRLVYVTERERFEVPVHAIGPRAILDFRDELHLPLCAVKASTQRTQLVRNVGNSKAKFTLHTQSPFTVTPSSGSLDVGEGMQDEYIRYNQRGEDVYISLYGTCEELNIYLEPDHVLMKNTFISLSCAHTVSLTNSSDIPLQYCWSVWPSQEEEELNFLRESSVLQRKEEEETGRVHFQCESDPTEIHSLSLPSRVMEESRSQTPKDHLLSHSCITVEPAEGEIWPNTTAQFNIVFKPEEAKTYQQTIYCDVTGRDSRLPLTIQGEGIGPELRLDYNLIDVKNVFINDKDCYEVLVTNIGLIDAPFKLSSPDTTFGRCFSFSPEEGVVPSGACQIVKVTLHSCTLGSFSEDLLLAVTGQPKPHTLTFRGCVVVPTFEFSVSELDFGDIGFGFPLTLVFSISNTSFVPMTFALRVPGDGLGSPSISCDKMEVSRNNWRSSNARDPYDRPMEFTVNPAVGSVGAMSDITIKVTLCSNTVKKYRLALVVDVEGVGEEIMTLPIKARCVVPEIVVETTSLEFQRCFLNYPYKQEVLLTNPSTLPVCCGVLDQEYEETPSLLFHSSSPGVVILPHTSEKFPLVLVAKAVGRLHHTLRIAVFGSIHPPLVVHLSCIGQGPIVHVQSPQLDFGRIPVLADITRTLLLSNHSPIPAHFTAHMSRRKSFWRVEPSEGEVPPESQLELCVVAHLKDIIHFQDRLEVSIKDGQRHIIPLSATGTGTTIICDRPLGPNLDLGTHFSHGPCQYKFKLTNHGKRVHRLYWRTDGYSDTSSKDSLSSYTVLPPITGPRKKDVPRRGSFASSGREKPVFSVNPSRLVEERLLCFGIVGKRGSSEVIMSVDVTCHFIAPMLSISPKQLNFYIEKVPGENIIPVYEKLILKNVTSLSLSMRLSLVQPFSLCEVPGAQSTATTKFLHVHYHGHPQQDIVGLRAEVNFPNLQFSSTMVDFGSVLNCTSTQRVITVTNCSPMPVSYHWAFLEDQKHCTIRETKILGKKEEQKSPENEAGEVRGSSRTSSPASLLSLSPRPGVVEQNSTRCAMCVEEVFDVLPKYGHLPPGEQQLVTFSFYGHEYIRKEVVAQCHVEEGPTYDIKLTGEASVITYSLDLTHVDFGQQCHRPSEGEEEEENDSNEEAEAQRKSFVEDEQQPNGRQQKDNGQYEKRVRPGQPMVIPSSGYIDAGAEQCLCVLYLPGAPEVFVKQLQLQVAFLPPQEITLTGEGVFPRISLNLPRILSEECYRDVVQQAREAVEANGLREELMNGNIVAATTEANYTLTYEEKLHMEIDRVLVKESALAVTDSSVSLLELRDSGGSSRQWYNLSKFLLPEYDLDFGYVIPGKVITHTVNVTNTGSVPVSYQANRKPISGTGFSAEFERVKNLPCGETQTFTIKFDPQEAKLQMGVISVVMPIKVVGGPLVQVRLRAELTMPSVTVSTDTLQFDTVQCGMCQMRTVQLLNHEFVPCHWSITEDIKPFKKVNRFLPPHQRKKALQEQRPPPVVFEMIPASGMLNPGERVNVQIKFIPAEGHSYNRQLVVCVANSTQRVIVTAQGQGEEPQLDFCPSILTFGPCLPLNAEVDAEVTVKNPCSFPIEFYSLEFDTQYLKEEKILRLMQGYDENNILLLPPRVPGESLPTELLDYYNECCLQKLKDDELKDKEETKKGDMQEEENSLNEIDAHPGDSKGEEVHARTVKTAELFISEMTSEVNSGRVGQLELTPVSRAIARHMCVDLSPEGLAAHNRRGVAIIVYGAPLTDKSSTATSLAHHYGGACLIVDAVVTDMLLHGTSPVSLTARGLYDSAVAEYAEKEAKEPAQVHEGTTELGPTVHQKASGPAPTSLDTEACSNENGTKHQETESTAIALRLGGDVTTLSSLLPDQLLVDILSERFQLSDCHRGIVIRGLESVYTQSPASTLQVVLKALNNRKHIYVVNLSDSYAALKARERARKEAEEALMKEKVDREEQWLKELDEEGYNALPEDQKEHITQKHRERLRQQKLREYEQSVKEQEERRQQEELKRLREEELKKRNKKGLKKDSKEAPKKKLDGRQSTDVMNEHQRSSCHNSKESLVDTGHHCKEAENTQKQTDEIKASQAESPKSTEKMEEQMMATGPKSTVDELQSQFIAYEQTQVQVEHILQHWDRAQLLLLVPLPSDEAPPVSEEPPTEKQQEISCKCKCLTDRKLYYNCWIPSIIILFSQSPAGKRGRKPNTKTMSPLPIQTAAPADADKEGDKVSPQDIIPHIVLTLTEKDNATEVLEGNTLPPVDQVLDDLGLGHIGPPIPSPVTFSVVRFPKNRKQSISQLTCDCFTFLAPSGQDEQGEEKDSEENIQALAVKEETVVTASKTRSRASIKETAVTKDKDKKGRESQRSRTRGSAKAKTKGTARSPLHVSTTSDGTEQHHGTVELKRNQRQGKHTDLLYILSNGEVVLKTWFYSDSPGRFEQTYNFELLGTQRQYQLVCRGICTYPSIFKDYMSLFALSKKVPRVQDGLQKSYVVKPGYFEFGPLLCSKSRDRYKESRYPENTERLVIHNNSGLEAEVQFRFQEDTQATTYLLDPPTMTLKPDQKQELTVWAYPTQVGQIKDSIVCCIKDNPEPVIINLSCWGVRPELELESKHLHFDRLLLHRQDSRSVLLHNKTALPVSWRLQGVEELGDEFSVTQDGIISPNSSFRLCLHFRASKARNIKKILRLEVSDVEKILGIVHTENIQVTAEAYDITLDLSPADGFLDFGIIKVFDEAKMSLRLKNQGKYEIAYKFTLEWTDKTKPKPDSIFTVCPQRGSLIPHEKPTTVQILCKPNTEVFIEEQPFLSCQLIEPNIGNGGEIIAILPIKVSVQSVFTRYKITPAYDINFGPLVSGCKRSQTITIENCGVFETRFNICRMFTDPALLEKSDRFSKKIPQENRLTMGVFSLSPCSGSLLPGCQQVVTVNCVAEQLGNWNQGLLIDISDRDPSDQPEGIPYRLLSEVCKPGVVLDMSSIFEEHHQCHNSAQLSSEQFCNAEGIYVLDENKFIFNKVLVMQTAQARFKLTNNSKVPCVLSMAIKYVGGKSSRNMEVFDLAATTLTIPSQSYSFAVVTFAPQAMQQYNAVFEATLEGASRMTPTCQSKVLEFDLMGEGNMPSVSVVHPALKSGRGSPVLQFKHVMVGQRHTLPLVLLNNGNVAAQVQIDMLDKHGVFTLEAAPGHTCSSIQSTQLEGTPDSEHHLVHRATLRLDVNEQMKLKVSFCPHKAVSVKAKMTLLVENNQYSNTIIRLTGETFQEIISFDNISRPSEELDQEDDESGNYEALDFGHCHVDCPYKESFTMTNHSSSQAVRFEWPPAGPHIFFSPQVGHLHAGCSKEVAVTFGSNQPVTLDRQPMRCKVSQVEFQQPLEQVVDWDDRQRTIEGLSASKQAPVTNPQQPIKNKVVKTDPEPCCSVVEGSQQEFELRVSAVCDYVRFSCDSDTIRFKDTMLYQSRLHQLQIVNQGSVKLEFFWQVLMDPSCNTVNNERGDETSSSRPGSGSAGALNGAHPSSALASVMSLLMRRSELPPLTIEPSIGAIEPGSMQKFRIHFSPLEVAYYQARLVCSIPNLQDGDQAPCISVCGRSLQPHCHFDLEDSDYISGDRRNPEFREPLDPNTRVIEFKAVGLPVSSTRHFIVVNPTSKAYSFKWKCEDEGGSPFNCLTPCGTIQPGKKVEMCFEYIAEQLDVVESSWSFVIETLSLSFPFLCVGTTREPLVYFSKPHLDFGELLVGRKVQQMVDLVNAEEEPFHFSVLQPSLICEDQQSSLSVQPMGGTVSPKDRLPLSVSFTPSQEGYVSFRLVLKVNRRSEPLTLSVKHGPTFTCVIRGSAVAPSLEFSFTKFNFGKCFLYCPGMVPASQTLVISNKGEQDISVESQFKNTPYLEMDFQSDILCPGAAMEIPVTFYPREACRYHEKVTFILNNCITKEVDILGQGIEMKLEVKDPKQRNIKLGFLMFGQTVKKQVVLINRSPLDLTFTLCLNTDTPLDPKDLSFSPASELKLRAGGGSCNVAIQFSPRQHIRPFKAELQAEIAGLLHPLLTVQGCCQGAEVQVDQDHLAFGAVVQRCQTSKRIVMMNTGDIGARFHWKTENFPPELSIMPAKGYICPGAEVPFDVTFAPEELSNGTRYENLSCLVESSPSPVILTVTGSCIVPSTSKEVINFVCPVRGSHTHMLPVVNPTNQQCSIRPIIEGKQWSAAPYVNLEPLQNKTYEITYRPLTMTTDEKKHEGSVFFSFPDGTGTLYSLQGTADPPKAEDTIVHELPAKTQHTQLLPVHNWLPKQQRFRVLIEILKPDKTDATVSLKGLEYVVVPALATREYKMSFFAYKEGHYNTKVTFHNDATNEYMFYLVTFVTTSPEALSTIELVTAARRTALATVQVENPLTTSTCLTTVCKCTDISVPAQHTVPGQSKSSMSFSYLPLRAGESTARLTLCSNDLGSFHYNLLLRALPPPPEKTVVFNTSLGRSHSVLVKFINYSRFKTEYQCKTDCPDFTVDKSLCASPGFQAGSEASVEVCFEPHQLGEVRGQLSLSSATSGEYIFPLHGICLPPKAQGPFNIRTGQNVTIPFKNVFLETTTFSFQVDNPCFTVKGVSNILSKKSQNILVSFEAPAEDHAGPWFGRMTISSQGLEGHRKPCSWVFYLKGYCLGSS
ncbi:hypothetical protein INR49_012446 [Caranx melampygus]|nr:hypothetical protein INR49_012446 [Caranx melampygus]